MKLLKSCRRQWSIPLLLIAIVFFLAYSKEFVINVSADNTTKLSENKAQTNLEVENKRFRLTMDEKGSGITLLDKESEKQWSCEVDDSNFDGATVNAQWKQRMSSLFQINYTDLQKGLGTIISAPLLSMEYDVKTEEISDGIRLSYDLKDAQIALVLEISVTKEGLKIRIPDEGIQEYGSYSLVSLDIMQYFAGASDKSDGYYFYPDGSGAIMEFQDISHKDEKTLSYSVYTDVTKYKGMQEEFEALSPTVMLPVFGAKIEENGFLAVISQGEEASSIQVGSSNDIIPVNSLWCQFLYRRGFDDPRIKEKNLKTYDKDRITGDREILFHFLEKNDADYSAMARNYREYLTEQGNLSLMEQTNDLPLSLDIFCGTTEKGLLFDEYKVLTTFSQADDMVKSFKEQGINQMQVQLKGWTKKGYGATPDKFAVNGKLGGEKELKHLLETGSTLSVPIYLEANFIEAKDDVGGFSKRNDVVYTSNQIIRTDTDNKLFLLSPDEVSERYNYFLKKGNKLDIFGIKLEGLGSTLYYNYNNKRYITALDCKNTWKEMLKQSKQNYKSAITSGGNAYVLGLADKITDIPESDLGYQVTTKEIPFYQMVVHGSVWYTGNTGNLSSDLTLQKLKWVEYGYLPYFELTHSSSDELIYTDYNQLFTSKYQDWSNEIVDIYKEMNKTLSGLWNQTIEKHEQIKEGVFKTVYSDGSSVYVNYNEEAVKVEGINLEALNYTVVRGTLQ